MLLFLSFCPLLPVFSLVLTLSRCGNDAAALKVEADLSWDHTVYQAAEVRITWYFHTRDYVLT